MRSARGEVGVGWHVEITMLSLIAIRVDKVNGWLRGLETTVIFQKSLTGPLCRMMHEHSHCREGYAALRDTSRIF